MLVCTSNRCNIRLIQIDPSGIYGLVCTSNRCNIRWYYVGAPTAKLLRITLLTLWLETLIVKLPGFLKYKQVEMYCNRLIVGTMSRRGAR